MWKNVAACAVLFVIATVGVGFSARIVAPSFGPAAAALGVCLVGMLLILLAPVLPPSDLRVERPSVTVVTEITATEEVSLPVGEEPRRTVEAV